MVSVQRACHNRLLAALPPADFARLQPHLMTVPLRIGEVLMAPGTPIRHVLFVEDGILSVIATASDDRQIELALIGREGLVGLPVLMGTDRSVHEGRVQASGYAWCLEADAMREILGTSPDLHAFLLRYAYSVTVQIAGTALANTRYKVDQRLARWLLMCHDRTTGDELPTTHRFLSLMLGINRPGLTTALSVFEQAGMIRTERGTITIRDRAALLAKAGACYGGPEGEYERLLVEGRPVSR
ncbi:hypothetical protein A5481_15815 [Methylobacterium platani]|uniref:CarD family transcriptional regulator n=1 Tax=Methylobacterium platani TaxID=427683 RepID=A0A179SC70_9HYPH|nr:hypothetical protein A5481_15815 [Methylobacterium platani]